MDRPLRRARDSYTEQVQIIMPQHVNGAQRLFGGQLMAWIDVAAAVAARRHAGRPVTTASVDELSFLHAANIDDTVVLAARVTYVGRTSMEVRVDTYVERLDGHRDPVNRAYLVMVALDENDNPIPVPMLRCETHEEELEWEAARRRRAFYKENKLRLSPEKEEKRHSKTFEEENNNG